MVQYYEVANAIAGDLACIRREDESDHVLLIPIDEANTDYRAYQEWLAEGNTPEPWPPAE